MPKVEYSEMLEKFIVITKKGWIKGINQSTNSVGLTFEKLMSKEPDSLYFPDFFGIELKCTQRYSRYPINLFSLAFDGPHLFEMNRLIEKYGIDSQLYGSLFINKYSFINNFNFKLKIDRINQKIILGIYDLYLNPIEEVVYIDFSNIKTRLEIKLSSLALVYASKKMINEEKYFRYYKIVFYKLKSFDKFINMLGENKIKVSILGRTAKSGIDVGKNKNKNLVFSLPKEYIEELFEKELEYDSDLD